MKCNVMGHTWVTEDDCFHVIHLSVAFWILLHILLNNLRILFIFCINVDTDEMLLLDKKKGIWINSFRVISLCTSEKVFWFLLPCLKTSSIFSDFA